MRVFFLFCRFEIFKLKSRVREKIGGWYEQLYEKKFFSKILGTPVVCMCARTRLRVKAGDEIRKALCGSSLQGAERGIGDPDL